MTALGCVSRRLTLGVMGHVDHGKTALVGALTGQDTDRLPEEKRRGVSIALGFAHARIGDAEIDFIDMPGHERFVRTLISGATGVDAALLLVAANEGLKPQTHEHLHIAALLGVASILPVISKADLVEHEALDRVSVAVERACRDVGIASRPALPVSVRKDWGLDRLGAALADLAAEAPHRLDTGFPWLPIDRAFTVAGRGTIVTGTLRRGRLRTGADLVLLPEGRAVRMRGLQVHGRAVETAEPGQRVAVNLRDLNPAEAPRGFALAPPQALAAAARLTVSLQALPEAAPLKTGERLALLVGSAEIPARLRLLEDETLAAGGATFAQIETSTPVAFPAGERFVLRLFSPAVTVAGGEILDPAAPRLRRRDKDIVARQRALSAVTLDARPRSLLDAAGTAGIALDRLARVAGRTTEAMTAKLEVLDAEPVGAGLAVATSARTTLMEQLVAALRNGLDDHPSGVTRRTLAAMVEASPPVLDAAVQRLLAEGRLQLNGVLVRLPPPRSRSEKEAAQALALAQAMAERLRAASLAPPDLGELAPSPAARRTLEALVKAGVAVKTLDRVQKRELVFHREAIAAACARLAPHLAPPGLTVGEVGAHLGVSRKFSVPLLEYLDAVRFTRRLGDRRVLGPAGPPT